MRWYFDFDLFLGSLYFEGAVCIEEMIEFISGVDRAPRREQMLSVKLFPYKQNRKQKKYNRHKTLQFPEHAKPNPAIKD